MTSSTSPIQAALIALVALGPACNGTSPDDPMQAEIDRIVAKDCEILAACECANSPHSDPEYCDATIRSDLASMVAGAAEAGLTLDIECLEAFSWGSYAGCRVYDELWVDPGLIRPHRCGECQIAYGEREVGERCTSYTFLHSTSNCAQGLACVRDDGEPRCVDPCASVVGSPCDWDTCGPEMYCNDEGRCARAGTLGESCEGSRCVNGLLCSNGSRTCIEIAGAGEPCTDIYDCDDDLFCDLEVGVCVADFDPGAACDTSFQCRGGYCDEGICVTYPAPGEPCYSSTCAEGATCQQVLGICVIEEPFICKDWR